MNRPTPAPPRRGDLSVPLLGGVGVGSWRERVRVRGREADGYLCHSRASRLKGSAAPILMCRKSGCDGFSK